MSRRMAEAGLMNRNARDGAADGTPGSAPAADPLALDTETGEELDTETGTPIDKES